MSTQSIAHRAETATANWWRGASLYQIYPRSFADSTGDGIGDLQGVTAHLEHVASLGVDGVWLSPFFRSPMRDFGYDVSDYCDVDPMFGTLADFDALVARAHGLGLRVIIDQVFSHTSDEHAWFLESRQDRTNPKADWYVWADPKPDGTPPSNWQSLFGGAAWTWDARRGQYYMHNFLSSQPQVNVHNPAVQDAIEEVLRFWFARGVDGCRLDAVSFLMHDPDLRDNPARPADAPGPRTRPYDYQIGVYNQSHPAIPQFLSRLRRVADAYDGRFLVAEIDRTHADVEMKAFTRGPDRLHTSYSFTYLYADRLTPRLVAEASADWISDEEPSWPSWTFSNHDAPRAISRWAQGRDGRAFGRMALFLLACLRGNIFVYQGEELGLPQGHVPFERLRDPEAIANWPQTLGRDGARTPMPWRADAPFAGFSTHEPWLPIDPAHAALAVDRQEADPAATLHVARRAMSLRARFEALRTGDMHLITVDEAILAFERRIGDARVLCVFNLGDTPQSWRVPEGWVVEDSVNWRSADALDPLAAVIATRLAP